MANTKNSMRRNYRIGYYRQSIAHLGLKKDWRCTTVFNLSLHLKNSALVVRDVGGKDRLDTRCTDIKMRNARTRRVWMALMSRPNEEDNLRNWVGAKKNVCVCVRERERERRERERERERDGKLSLSSSFTLLEEARGTRDTLLPNLRRHRSCERPRLIS